jgi:hypothetical protein
METPFIRVQEAQPDARNRRLRRFPPIYIWNDEHAEVVGVCWTQNGVATPFPPVFTQSASVRHDLAQMAGQFVQSTRHCRLQSQVEAEVHEASSEGQFGIWPPPPEPPDPAPPEPPPTGVHTQPGMASQFALAPAMQPTGTPVHAGDQ